MRRLNGMGMVIGLLAAAPWSGTASAQQAPESPAGYAVTPDARAGQAATRTGPVLRLPGADWTAAGAAEGVGAGASDLAGDPSAHPLGKPKLAPADQDSFFNTQEWQNINTPKGGHGHRSALQQLAGAGEGMSLNLAVDGLTKLVDGH